MNELLSPDRLASQVGLAKIEKTSELENRAIWAPVEIVQL